MQSNNFLDDPFLIQSLQKGDMQAFNKLYNRYWKPLYYVAFKFTGSSEESEDIVQELFFDLWEKRASLSIRDSLAGYLHASLKNRLLNMIRHQAVKDKYVQRMVHSFNGQHNATEETIKHLELQEMLKEYVSALPVQRQKIFYMSKIEGLSVEEIAEKLKISPQTVKNQLYRALQTLRLQLRNYVMQIIIFASFFC